MKIPYEQALRTTQMIVPEVDLGLERLDTEHLQVGMVPLPYWCYYIDALENASDLLITKLGELPDVKPVTEIESISEDIGCLITALSLLYVCTLNEVERINKNVNKDVKRFDKYRKKINRRKPDDNG